jgi:hypothetical protein
MALFEAADSECLDSLVQIVEQRKFLPHRHTPNDVDLELLHFGISIRIQSAHDFSIAQLGKWLSGVEVDALVEHIFSWSHLGLHS